MNLLDLGRELGLSLKKHSSTHGGEYKSQCPKCQEGTDRFCVWPHEGMCGRYWCRVCGSKGDAIQFCRDFMGLTFHEACQKTQTTPRLAYTAHGYREAFVQSETTLPSINWRQAAAHFIAYTQEQLLQDAALILPLTQRGLILETVKRFRLGWNPESLFRPREKWGLPEEVKENGEVRRQWLPKGIVIPSYLGEEPAKLKIRRSDWSQEDRLPKYVEISGSHQSPAVYGDLDKPFIIVESELDAILIQQEASHLVCSVALGGVSKKPDAALHRLLNRAPMILLSLDFDDPGKKRNAFWMKSYSQLRPWPSPQAKSVGDAFQACPNKCVKWIQDGLRC